ncbi:UBX domain-containing protein [Plectosphaerella plurivora]|uniref:UBX domain-containing protein n=1 Tax=Plectosphaerella plurivora TaxID=936078 RepID=A0A9P8V5Q8_9PEZI|nr:UBX domain-containing protein [Plectosphaerella plurivora]
MDEDISNFAAITNADPQVARGFLEMSGGNLEAAIQLYFENPDIQNSFGAAGAASVPPALPRANTRPGTGSGADRPIEIDSDDDDNIMTIDDDEDDFVERQGSANAAQVARNAQEEEDAAMAKRLQEELYGGGGAGGAGAGSAFDDVRSPIRATRETLVEPGGFGGGGFGQHDDDEVDVPALIQEQMRQRQAARARAGGRINNPFNHEPSIWDADGGPRRAATSTSDERSQRLAELFRPPYDLLDHEYNWEEARTMGKEEKKWILVNFQDNSIFHCQMLNRDIWKDAAIRGLVKENFIFLQYTKNSLDAQQFMTFYFPQNSHENPDNFPHVSIIDPRTGEQVKVWSGIPFPSAPDFHAQLVEFLDRYSLDATKKNPVASSEASKRPQVVDVDRMTEDEMLEMALQASMATANGSGSSSKPGVVDPDSLTKAKEEEKPAEEAAPPPQSPFASIASDQPHTEPENNPATTTRIQFRHPSGRVIRRFNLDDTVRRIYEWLKAEPLEGKEGIVFELKQMPQGQDLMAMLDQTIAEAGLKQGTVMIEFIED